MQMKKACIKRTSHLKMKMKKTCIMKTLHLMMQMYYKNIALDDVVKKHVL